MLALGPNVLVDPLQIGLALREAREEVLARHAGVTHADLHDQPLLTADDLNDAAQVLDQHVEQLGRELQLHELIGQLPLQLDRLLVLETVFRNVGQCALVQPANDLDPGLDFIRVRPGVDDFLFLFVLALGCRRLDLVGLVRIDETDDEILHAGLLRLYRFSYGKKEADRRREVRHVPFDLIEAVLDALCDLDFALAGQQFDRAHLAHVHAHRVGRAAEFGVHAGERGLRFLGSCVVVIRDGGIRQQDFLGIRCFFVHRDAHVVNHVDDVFDLLGIDNVIRQMVIDLCVGQETLFLATGNQVFQLLRLLVAADSCAFFRQGQRTPM